MDAAQKPPRDRERGVHRCAVAAWDFALERICGHYALSSGVISRRVRLTPSDKILDVGGGTGGVSAALRDRVSAVVVIEPSEPLTRRGQRRYPGVAFTLADGRKLPVRDASVDHVLLVEVLHHVADADAVLREAARVVRPGGSILIEESEWPGLSGRVRFWAERLLLGGVWPRTRPELLARLQDHGFHGEVHEDEGFVVVARRATVPAGR